MTEYERVRKEIAKLELLVKVPEGYLVPIHLDNEDIDQILSFVEIKSDDQTIVIPCYQDGDTEKATYIKAKPPSWITDAGFVRVISKPKRK